MKTPLPEPVHIGWASDGKAPRFGYTADQLRAAMVAAYNEGIEEAAKVCELESIKWKSPKYNFAAASANHCAKHIRAYLKETP